MPLKIEGHDPGLVLVKITDDRKIGVFNPFDTEMDDFNRDVTGLEEVGQPKESDGKKVDRGIMMERPIVICGLGDVEKKAIHSFHRGNCKTRERPLQPFLRDFSRS
jgi:hypothetical protein